MGAVGAVGEAVAVAAAAAVVAAVESCLILPFADCDLGALLKSWRPIVHSNYELPTLIQ